ncbi:MAG: protein-tyrosine-phosphatase [Xanthomonadales bacterium]|nr:metallophosphoesterase [Gammaproteobacteria bacterium]NNK50095.1 protein-tyrosine-phosphatase [Xanthomonadales bacterium]
MRPDKEGVELNSDEKNWKTPFKCMALSALLTAGCAFADARQIDEFQWEGVERIVAIGDLHGDYENYIATLKAAGLVDKKSRWSGGKTHLVQTGDIPDRGPDTVRIIEHITKLGKQARKKGGYVHNLIGNHEAMNVYGDLRYVSEGEFEAFVTRNSEKLRDRVFNLNLERLESSDPEAFAALPGNFRELWYEKHPLGWVEHRQAWDPAWNPDAEFASWVLDNKVAVRINDNLFLHGGISGFYCQNSLRSLTEKVVGKLARFDPANTGILDDAFGPLWYRGLSGVEPVAPVETVDAVLNWHKASHIMVGHTPTSGVIWPRYGGKVVMIDTGIARAYGGNVAYLEITPKGLFAGYPKGKLPLPTGETNVVPYLEKVIAMDPENSYLQQRLEKLLHPAVPTLLEESAGPGAGESAAEDEDTGPEIPICGISE